MTLQDGHLNPKWPNPGLMACREGRTFCGWVNSKTGVAAQTVLTDSGFLMPLEPGKRYFLACFYFYLSTLSDWARVEWGVTVNSDGTGAFTALTPRYRIDTGNVQSGRSPNLTHLGDVPLTVTDANGGAFTARVQGNDAGATFNLGYHGWWEEIAT